jgi:KaiC/GvpD/RAD55 family RecA-like ATPase
MNLLIVGPPGTGKRLWLKKLIKPWLKGIDDTVLYVTIEIPPEEVPYEGIIVDCYSERVGQSSQKYHATCAYDLDEIYKQITLAIDEFTGSYLVLDSLTPLLLTLGLPSVYRFLQKLLAYVKINRLNIFSIIHRGAHDEKEEISLFHLFEDALFLEKLNNGKKVEYYYHRNHDAAKKQYTIHKGEIRE